MLTRDQVEFTVTIEPEYDAPEGHFAYDTEEENEQACSWIREQLSSGNDLAWCCVVVAARAKDPRLAAFVGTDSLGGVSCADRADFDQLVADHGMEGAALDALNREIESVRAALCPLHSRG